MLSDDLRAAAERRRRLQAGREKSQDIYGVTVDEAKGRRGIIEAGNAVKRMMLDDERALADYAQSLVLAEHPADDGVPWMDGDGSWVRSMGFTTYDDPVAYADMTTRPGLCVQLFCDGRAQVNGGAVPCKTRGHVRRLLAALGVPQ